MSNLKAIGDNFANDIAEGVVVVDFWANWCMPCKMLAPILDEVSENFENVKFFKVDVDQYPDLAREHKVSSIPNLCLFVNGEFKDRLIGVVPEDDIVEFIKKHLN